MIFDRGGNVDTAVRDFFPLPTQPSKASSYVMPLGKTLLDHKQPQATASDTVAFLPSTYPHLFSVLPLGTYPKGQTLLSTIFIFFIQVINVSFVC
jgi:hypothetical protein